MPKLSGYWVTLHPPPRAPPRARPPAAALLYSATVPPVLYGRPGRGTNPTGLLEPTSRRQTLRPSNA